MTWKQTLKAVVVAGLWVEASFAAKQEAAPSVTLLVRFCDEAGLSDAEFGRFRDKAASILEGAGIASNWFHCSFGNSSANPPECRGEVNADEVVVLLRSRSPKGREEALGMSLLTEKGTGVHAHLYFTRVRELAARFGIDALSLLSFAAVHEICHLLTGPIHYPWGIMQASWSHKQVEGLINGGILFTQPHARKLQAGLAARTGQVLAASK